MVVENSLKRDECLTVNVRANNSTLADQSHTDFSFINYRKPLL